MKLNNMLFCLFTIVIMCTQISAKETNPVVSNVAFSISGATVTVNYDVSDSEQTAVTIVMQVSSDDGATWNYNYGSASGDIGSSISIGSNKSITWTYSGSFNPYFKIKIIANDETADGSPCAGTEKVYYEGGPNNDVGGDYYKTIQIGDQCWLKENLNVGTRINGTGNQIPDFIIEKYCYDDLQASCTTYGGLYQWNEAMKYTSTEGTQGICPNGWHIPTLAEYETLYNTINNDGNELEAVGVGTGGTNTSGFSSLLGGGRSSSSPFFDLLDKAANYWTSTKYEFDATKAMYMDLYYFDGTVKLLHYDKEFGFSVRCVKD